MKNIIITQKVYEIVEYYVRSYRVYYQELFEDTGIWNEPQIILGYQNESIQRYTEILEIIALKLANPLVSYPNNSAIIRWKSKILLVSFTDDKNTRIITDLEIR